ncbi:BnaCnng70800D [Brassica napus]|uniref:BnaCnng70800D protein n=1 Tax=Brassica napus TaxID=3708 RepID=A0A078JZI2_BRANA|nr:BnaCnng70800D [Brassica napus]
MKSHIQGMFKSSFTALGLEVRDLIEDRFTKLEQTILSSQTPVGTHGAAPAYTQTHGAALTYTHTPAAATTSTQAPGSDSTVAPTPVSTHASAPATTSRARASRNKASVPSHTGGPATAAKTRSQTKDPELSDVFGSLFDTLDFNLGTQEHLQKTMGNLTQESHVKGFDPSQEIFNRPFLNDIDDPEVRCKDNDYELVFVLKDKFFKLTEWILKPKVLQIGPSKFDAELASRIMGPNEWLKNNDMDNILYFIYELYVQ